MRRSPTAAGTGRKVKQFALWCGAICLVAAAVNANVSRLQVRSADAISKVSQKAIASTGRVLTASGLSISTAVAKQGAAQCSSSHASDTPTAQCQSFCNDKFKKFHCLWCKCRACTFCPKGSAAIEQAATDDSPPPPSPPPPLPSAQDGSRGNPSLLLGGAGADSSLHASSTRQDYSAEQGVASAMGGEVAATGAAAEPGAREEYDATGGGEEAAANAALDALPATQASTIRPASKPQADGEAANQGLGELALYSSTAGEGGALLPSVGGVASSVAGDGATAAAGTNVGEAGQAATAGSAAVDSAAAKSAAGSAAADGADGSAVASEAAGRETDGLAGDGYLAGDAGLAGVDAEIGSDADALLDAVGEASYAEEGEEQGGAGLEGGFQGGLEGGDIEGDAAQRVEAAQAAGVTGASLDGEVAGADAVNSAGIAAVNSAGAAGGGGAASLGEGGPDADLSAGLAADTEGGHEEEEAGGGVAVD